LIIPAKETRQRMDRKQVRQQVWNVLRGVARPDSRFHFDFNEYIPDFEGSDAAIARLTALDLYRNARTIFITPDNGLQQLRAQAVRDGKLQYVTTYGIRRGTVEIRPEAVPPGQAEQAAMLDGMEQIGRYISLAELRQRGPLDVLVTGASAVSRSGVRFGKGHGFFDLEWAMFYQIGIARADTPVVAVVHDCQVLEDDLTPDTYDTLCDLIVTPTRLIEVPHAQKPTHGVLWDRLEPGMLDSIPPLRELQALQAQGLVAPQGGA
jgi:5-formyltetrahydrofolate cyclo-ligase